MTGVTPVPSGAPPDPPSHPDAGREPAIDPGARGLYARVAAWRRRRYAQPGKARRLARPVISVGNVASGGRGKTPIVARLARLLVEAGERPAILSRGYRRTDPVDGVTVVSDGVRALADLARAGDEPLMLARGIPGAGVFVCPDRFWRARSPSAASAPPSTCSTTASSTWPSPATSISRSWPRPTNAIGRCRAAGCARRSARSGTPTR